MLKLYWKVPSIQGSFYTLRSRRAARQAFKFRRDLANSGRDLDQTNCIAFYDHQAYVMHIQEVKVILHNLKFIIPRKIEEYRYGLVRPSVCLSVCVQSLSRQYLRDPRADRFENLDTH